MDENYIVINGKRTELTEEQLEKLGIETKKKSPFEFQEREKWYAIDPKGGIFIGYDSKGANTIIEEYAKAANYCTDKKLMEERALHETLNRLLWRFSCENGELENPWDNEHKHYYIAHDMIRGVTVIDGFHMFAKDEGVNYFPTEEIAQRAIDEVVKPFMQEHFYFKW